MKEKGRRSAPLNGEIDLPPVHLPSLGLPLEPQPKTSLTKYSYCHSLLPIFRRFFVWLPTYAELVVDGNQQLISQTKSIVAFSYN